MAKRPTGPQPQTATVSPGSMSQFSAAIQPVGRMSDRNRTFSSSSPSGMTMGPTSESMNLALLGARRLRGYGAPEPSGRAKKWAGGSPACGSSAKKSTCA